MILDKEGRLVAGGNFSISGGRKIANIAVWNSKKWLSLGEGFNGPVFSIARDDKNNLYAAGDFTLAGNVKVNGIAKWNGYSWEAIDNGIKQPVFL